MGIASLVLGIISFGMSFIPVVGIIAIIPIIISITLGIVKLVKLNKEKNVSLKETKINSIVGIVLSSLATVLIITWLCVIAFAISIFKSYEDDFTDMINEDNNIKVEQNKEIDEYKESIREKF